MKASGHSPTSKNNPYAAARRAGYKFMIKVSGKPSATKVYIKADPPMREVYDLASEIAIIDRIRNNQSAIAKSIAEEILSKADTDDFSFQFGDFPIREPKKKDSNQQSE